VDGEGVWLTRRELSRPRAEVLDASLTKQRNYHVSIQPTCGKLKGMSLRYGLITLIDRADWQVAEGTEPESFAGVKLNDCRYIV
jgi:hypothetical protein